MINFGDALRKGLRFCIEPKRWLPLFILDATVFGIVIHTLLTGMNSIMESLIEIEGNSMAPFPVAGYFIGLLLLGVMWYVIRLWILSSLVHQSIKPMDIEKAYRLSFSMLHKVIAATLLLAIISSIVGTIPLAGWIFSIIISLMFFFMMQGIIIDKLGVITTLKNSYGIFRKDPFDVFVVWFLIAIISTLILGLFSLPLVASFFGVFFSAVGLTGTIDSGAMALLLIYLQENVVHFVAMGLVALLGVDVSQVFSIKAQTEFYLQLKKKFPSVLKTFTRKRGEFL